MIFNFESGCPIEGCPNKRKLISWKHGSCGAEQTIDCDGFVQCKNGHFLGEFYLLGYSCGEHQDFGKQTISSILESLSVSPHYSAEFAFRIAHRLIQAYKIGRLKD